ncbi:MAG: HAMP domain-containing protein, partial [Elusimicrobia bacterium]|nr:HAMP domain-containing protein [Elusimicrobiota bacterium]
MSLTKKIFLSYGIIILISVVITVIATVRMNTLNEFILTISNNLVPILIKEEKLDKQFDQLASLEKKFRILHDEELKEGFFKGLENLKSNLEQIEEQNTHPKTKEILNDIRLALTHYEGLFHYSVRGPGPLRTDHEQNVKESETRLVRLIGALFNSTEENLKNKLMNSQTLRKNTERFIWIFLSLAIVVMGILGGIFAQYLTYSLRRLQQGARKIADGNFDYELSVRSHDEVGDLTADFNAMAQKLSAMENAKAQFMSMVMHDLKGPITALKAGATMLLEKKKAFSAELHDSLELINHEVEHLNRMIDDLNEIAHIDSGTYR